jgi:hypothetical protein
MAALTVILDVKQVAAILGMTPPALHELRRAGGGPPCFRYVPRGRVVYRLHDVVHWVSVLNLRAASALEAVYAAAVTEGIDDHNELRTRALTAARQAQEKVDASLTGTQTRH